jgi:hypothetical protein
MSQHASFSAKAVTALSAVLTDCDQLRAKRRALHAAHSEDLCVHAELVSVTPGQGDNAAATRDVAVDAKAGSDKGCFDLLDKMLEEVVQTLQRT